MTLLSSLLLAIVAFFISYSFFYWQTNKPFKTSDKRFEMAFLIGVTVIFLLWFLSADQMKVEDSKAPKENIQSINKNSNSGDILKLISVILTIITGMVFITAQSAITKLNGLNDEIDEKLDGFKEQNIKLSIFQHQVELYQYNQKILNEYDQESINEEYYFRSILSTIYSVIRIKGTKDFLNYTATHYNKNIHNPLNDLEHDYIDLLFNYFTNYPDEMDENELQLTQIKKIRRS